MRVCRRIGPALLFERLWQEVGCRAVLDELAAQRQFAFAAERAVFLTVLHRLFVSGSDRAAEKWRADYRVDGTEELQLHHLYRAMAWLGERSPIRRRPADWRRAPAKTSSKRRCSQRQARRLAARDGLRCCRSCDPEICQRAHARSRLLGALYARDIHHYGARNGAQLEDIQKAAGRACLRPIKPYVVLDD
jgi:hypothetical protein